MAGCSRPGQCQRGEETDAGERQIKERHRATEKPAARKREEEGRYVLFYVFRESFMLSLYPLTEAAVFACRRDI